MSLRRVTAVAMVLGSCVATVTVAPAAHADTGYGYCQAAGCNGLDPIKENCLTNATTVSSIEYPYRNGQTYEIVLMFSPDCQANWARALTSTAVKFCVMNSNGNIDRYTSAPRIWSWTNMVNGAYPVRDVAKLQLPRPSDSGGLNVLYADDTPHAGMDVAAVC